jgi:hypothetical protein
MDCEKKILKIKYLAPEYQTWKGALVYESMELVCDNYTLNSISVHNRTRAVL